MLMVNVGFGNTVVAGRVVAVIKTGSSPARKLKEKAKADGKLLDMTEGRRTRSLLIMDSGHIVLSFALAETITQRLATLSEQVPVHDLLKEAQTEDGDG
ncbi:MAG: DUF370 domain-containing protein [Desulfobulbaceae bacterium]|jgi:regulator of extracellular matrix RemA (YlzA/DUF370 family)|nr:DUF370 domain-containing protein [Desulfobulbaceae bacterium]